MSIFVASVATVIAAAFGPPPHSPTAKLNALVAAEYSGERARSIVAFMDHYFRTPGNPGFDASIDRVAALLDSAGYVLQERAKPTDRLVYRIERYHQVNPAWEPVDASVMIVGQAAPILQFATNRNMLAINSWSTAEGGVDADVVFAAKATPQELAAMDVRGKIVYVEGRPTQAYGVVVVKGGALGVLSYSLPAYTQPDKHPTSIQFGAVLYDTTAKGFAIALSTAARDALLAAKARGGVRVHVTARSRFRVADDRALIAEARGRKAPDERFVFSAHVQEPGANDNATGVGAQAEMARVAAVLINRKSVDPDRTITFIWGDEIRATRRYLEQDSVRLLGVKWGMSLDMVGEDTKLTGGTFLIEKMPDPSAIWTRGADHHTEWGGRPLTLADMRPHWFNDYVLGRCLEQAAKSDWVVKTNPFEGGSDHTPFIQSRKPGLLLWHFTDVYYHTDGDRIDKVSATTMSNVGTSALTAALGLVTATDKTARAIVDETTGAAEGRLAAEEALGAAEIAAGKTAASQREIIDAWRDWYLGALDHVTEIELGGLSADVRKSIDRAKAHVTELATLSEAKLK